jgi:hypothetical protein
VDGELTYKRLDPIFAEIGYEHLSSDVFKQMFTWARPRAETPAEDLGHEEVASNLKRSRSDD